MRAGCKMLGKGEEAIIYMKYPNCLVTFSRNFSFAQRTGEGKCYIVM